MSVSIIHIYYYPFIVIDLYISVNIQRLTLSTQQTRYRKEKRKNK